MNRSEILYLFPYFISLAVSIGVLAYAWWKRDSQGSAAFTWFALGQTLWIAGSILELISVDLAAKIIWDSFQFLASALILITLPVFILQYTGQKLPGNSHTWFRLSLIAPGMFVFFLFTDAFFHWIYANPRLIDNAPFLEMRYDFTPFDYGYALYSYALILWGLTILVQRVIRPHGLYRGRVAMITLGFLILVIGTILSFLNVHIAQRDITPFTATLGNIIIVWGLFRLRILQVEPIARGMVFEAMVEPVVIIDNQNLVADINSSMLVLLGKSANEVMGQPAAEVFNDFPIPIKMYIHTTYGRAEATFELGGLNIHYELTVWPLFNSHRGMAGRIYICHDITALKELERELRKLNTELEDRVRARTSELAEAYDTTLEGWARALELRDKETEGHSRRVTETTLKIAREMGLPEEVLEHIRRGALLHDIGKMSISDEILHKAGSLTDEERTIVQKHPETAHTLLAPIPFLNRALEIPYCHHEKWDGTGYPRGLKGREIPLSARIFAVADVWDALITDRPYNAAWPREQAISFFIDQTGKHFDPRIVNVFLNMLEEGKI